MSQTGRETRRILITVKTYPSPSIHYVETVCVAGVDIDTHEWVRLYPVPFRTLPEYSRFRKYHIVEVEVTKHTRDPRPESWDPDWDSFRVLDFVDTADDWAARWHYLRPAISASMCEIQRRQKEAKLSLGCFRPAVVEDLIVRDDTPEWTGKQRAALEQQRLFHQPKAKLEKIPFKFSYRYRCADPECTGHTQRLLDWEVFELYRNVRSPTSSPADIKDKIRAKFLGELCAPNRDTYFFVGNHSAHPASFMVLGVFWPPRGTPSLFRP